MENHSSQTHTTRQEPALGGAWDDEEPSVEPRSPLLKKELRGPSPILRHPQPQHPKHRASFLSADTRLAERGGTVSASPRGASRGYEEEEPDGPRSKPGDSRSAIRTRGSGLPKPALSSAARSSIRSARGPAAGSVSPQPQHPRAAGPKATQRRSRGRAWERARGPAPPAKMFPLGVIDRLECRETKLFMR